MVSINPTSEIEFTPPYADAQSNHVGHMSRARTTIGAGDAAAFRTSGTSRSDAAHRVGNAGRAHAGCKVGLCRVCSDGGGDASCGAELDCANSDVCGGASCEVKHGVLGVGDASGVGRGSVSREAGRCGAGGVGRGGADCGAGSSCVTTGD